MDLLATILINNYKKLKINKKLVMIIMNKLKSDNLKYRKILFFIVIIIGIIIILSTYDTKQEKIEINLEQKNIYLMR